MSRSVFMLISSFFLLVSKSTFAFGAFRLMETHALNLPPFYKIHCASNMRLSVTGTYPVQKVLVEEDDEAFGDLVAQVKHGTLYLQVKRKQGKHQRKHIKPVQINIKNNHLKTVYATGNCQVNLHHLRSRGIDLIAKNNSRINARGKIYLHDLIAKQRSRVNVLWVQSRDLTVHASAAARVKLAGVAKRMHLKSYNRAKVDTQYLRVRQVYVKTTGKALAAVLATRGIRAFASGQSHIYYYKLPRTAMLVTRLSGNVFLMGYRQ